MKIEQVLYMHEVLADQPEGLINVVYRMIRNGGLFDQDYSVEYHSKLDLVYDLLNDMRVEGVEDARYWQEQIVRYQAKNYANVTLDGVKQEGV